MVEDIKLKIEVKFETSEEAGIIYESLLPEINDHRFDRSQVSVAFTSSKLIFKITSIDISAAKANINTIFRWIDAVSESINFVTKKIVKGNDKP
jgi:tRNA threonylcarbamoyladenosine modification (KEOPS) complex  Pcc1 subunit